MSLPKHSAALYRCRDFLSGALLLTAAYFIVFSWLSLPPLTLFLGWHPDTKLVVLPTIEEQYHHVVQPGDVVLAIDGRSVHRGGLIFPPPTKPVYELTLQRGNDILIQEIVVGESQFFQVWELSKAVLALLIWFLGFLTVRFARPGQLPAVIVGLSFQLIAVGIVSPGPAQLGASGGWLVGQVLVFYFPQIMLYLSFIPYYVPLNAATHRLLRGSFVFLTGWALAAAVEQLFLFPETSLADFIGVRSQTVLTVLAGISLVTAVSILLIRLLRQPKHSYERQQLTVLFVFLSLAVTPLFFFVIVPVDQTATFPPFPFIYSFLLLAPAGYFFVLHRQGRLELDVVFSRIVTIVVLILAVAMAYATGVYLFEAIFHLDPDTVMQGVFALMLFGTAIIGQKPVQEYVDLLVYGRDLPGDDSLKEIKVRLSANPEPATVTNVVTQIAAYFQVQETAVLVKNKTQYTWLAGNTPAFTAPLTTGQGLCLRLHASDNLAGLPEWVELSLPISARGDVLGLFLLSRPINGYLNSQQVKLLQDVADILAFGLLVISLVEAMHDLSQRALYEKELQRQRIATEIHNEPLHALTTLVIQLQAGAGASEDESVTQTMQTVRQVTRDLRRIISGLRPPVLKEAVEWIARQVVQEFDETHPDILVSLHLDVDSEQQSPEPTKMAFYYILTEALNNVSKHTQATRVDVVVRYGNDGLTLAVQDNGAGPGVAMRPLAELLRQHHLGVADMHRWASVGGGKLEIEENKLGGTIVRFTMPVAVPTTTITTIQSAL